MGPPTVSMVFIVVLGLTVTLPEPAMAQVQANSAAGEDNPTTTNVTREGQDQCSPLQRRQDLLDNRMNSVDNRMTERNSDINTRLNGLNTRQNEADSRLNGLITRQNEADSRLNGLITQQNETLSRLNGLITQQNEADSRLNSRLNGVDNRINGLNTSLNTRLSVDTDLSTRLNGLHTRQNEVDSRLSRMDSRFDDLETAMSDMKEYLRQRLDAMEVKAEWALTATKQPKEVTSPDNQPTTAPQLPKDCQEAYTMGSTSSGVYRIAPEPNTHVDVYCEQELDGGGWTVFQVRKDGSVDFYRDWNAYKQGFGVLAGEFWLGNSNLHLLTKQNDQEFKVELTSRQGVVKFADYSHFSIAPEADYYRLSVSGYTGGTLPGDSLTWHNGMGFSTKDRDHDTWGGVSCATRYVGAWWYKDCGYSSLNGLYAATGHYRGLIWYHWRGDRESLKATRMMIRKKP